MFSDNPKRSNRFPVLVLGAFLILNLLFLPVSFGQNSNLLSKSSTLFQQIANYQDASKLDSAEFLIKGGLVDAERGSDLYQKLKFASMINLYQKGEYDSIRVVLSDLQSQLEEKDENYDKILFFKALLESVNGNFNEAIELMIAAATRFESRENFHDLAVAYNNLGVYFKNLNQLQRAASYYRKALLLNKELNNEILMTQNLNNLGVVFSSKGDLDSALFFYEEASVLLRKKQNFFFLAQNTLNRGNILEKKGDYAGAMAKFEECLAISSSQGFSYGIILSNINIGNLSRIIKDFSKAELFLNEALDLAKKRNLRKEKAVILERLSWLKRDQELFKDAYELTVAFNLLDDSLANERVVKESNELLAKYETEKNKAKILELSTTKQKSHLFISVLTIGFMILILIVMWIESRRRKNELEKITLDREKKNLQNALELKNQELTLQASQLLKIQTEIQRGKEKILELVQLEVPDMEPSKRKHLQEQIRESEIGAGLIDDFDARVTETNEDFFKILLQRYPNLKPSELRLCVYLRLNLSTKEIAEITNKSTRTVETVRLSIRKKMGLEKADNLVAHLIALELQG